jgi:misshapen/NIK-related kinase
MLNMAHNLAPSVNCSLDDIDLNALKVSLSPSHWPNPWCHVPFYPLTIIRNLFFFFLQDPAGIFELIEVVGNGTYGQVYKVSVKTTVASFWL